MTLRMQSSRRTNMFTFDDELLHLSITNSKLMVKFEFDHDQDVIKQSHVILDNYVSAAINQQVFDEIVCKMIAYIKSLNLLISSPKIVVHLPEVKQSPKECNGLSHNQRYYKHVTDLFDVTNEHDAKFIANKFGKYYSKYSCIDNYRICFSDEAKTKTREYCYRADNGCCGTFDLYITNQYTGNSFWIGFNHGH